MCFYIKLKLIPQGDVVKAALHFYLPSSNDAVWQGIFPDYELTNGFCACPFVKGKGESLVTVPEVLKKLLKQSAVKRLNLIWYWGEFSAQKTYSEIKLTLAEFLNLNEQQQLSSETWYSINDPSKYVSFLPAA